MGTDPTAAARWIGYWPLRSRMRVDAGGLAVERRMLATSRFLLEATKWRALCGGGRMLVDVYAYAGVYICMYVCMVKGNYMSVGLYLAGVVWGFE
jgi:hypothetical protein